MIKNVYWSSCTVLLLVFMYSTVIGLHVQYCYSCSIVNESLISVRFK